MSDKYVSIYIIHNKMQPIINSFPDWYIIYIIKNPNESAIDQNFESMAKRLYMLDKIRKGKILWGIVYFVFVF